MPVECLTAALLPPYQEKTITHYLLWIQKQIIGQGIKCEPKQSILTTYQVHQVLAWTRQSGSTMPVECLTAALLPPHQEKTITYYLLGPLGVSVDRTRQIGSTMPVESLAAALLPPHQEKPLLTIHQVHQELAQTPQSGSTMPAAECLKAALLPPHQEKPLLTIHQVHYKLAYTQQSGSTMPAECLKAVLLPPHQEKTITYLLLTLDLEKKRI